MSAFDLIDAKLKQQAAPSTVLAEALKAAVAPKAAQPEKRKPGRPRKDEVSKR